MKSKILTFVIGFLVGAIVATGGFLIYQNVNKNNNTNNFDNGRKMRMMDGNNMGTPPDMTDVNNMGEPPAKPEGEEENSEQTPLDMPSDEQAANSNQNNSTKKNSTKNNSTQTI